jgi:DNA-binding SARP family transcriptional activator
MFELKLFGSAGIEGPEGPLGGRIVQRRQVALLAVLALSARRTASRDRLLALFWPEADAERARHSLADTVYVVRKALGEDALRSLSDDLVLDGERVRSDVEAFEAALAAGDPARAVSLHAGPLLEGFHLPDAPEFERWLDDERARLAQAHARALEELAGASERQGDPLAAVEWWRRLASAEPYTARVALGLMRALTAAGDRAGAIRHAEVHTSVLAGELGVEPEPEVVAYLDTLRSAPEGTPGRIDERVAPVVSTPASAPPEPELPVAGDEVGDEAEEAPVATAERRVRPDSVRRHDRRPAMAPLVAALALLTLGASWFLAWRPGPELHDRRLRVVPFENRTGDAALDAVGFLVADWITQGLLRTRIGEAVPGTEDFLGQSSRTVEQRRPGSAPPSPRELALEAGAASVVYGAYYRRADSLEFQAQVLDARSGRLVHAAEPVRAPLSDPGEGIERLRGKLLGILAAHFDETSVWHSHAGLTFAPPPFEVYRLYAEGSEHFSRSQHTEAIERLEAAFRLDSTFASALLMLSVAHLNLGGYATSDSLAQLVEGLSDRPTPHEQLLHGWLRAFLRGDVAGQLRFSRQAPRFAPGAGMHFQAGRDAVQNNRPREALEHFRTLDPSRGWLRNWQSFWDVSTLAHHQLGQHRQELREARRGRQQHPERLSTLWYEARALAALGEVTELERLLDEALAPPPHRSRPRSARMYAASRTTGTWVPRAGSGR